MTSNKHTHDMTPALPRWLLGAALLRSAFSTSATPTPSTTPTSTPSNVVALFQATSIIALRVGDAYTQGSATGVAQPIYLDEIDPTGLDGSGPLVRTVAVPASGSSACTLATGQLFMGTYQWYDQEGWPQVSGNGQLVSFPCFRVANGTTITNSASSVLKVIVLLAADGSLDLTTTTTAPYGGSATAPAIIHTAATFNGTFFWIATSGTNSGGFFRVVYAIAAGTGTRLSGATAGTPGYADAHATGVFNNQLYGSDGAADAGWNEVFAIGSGLPTFQTQTCVPLSGTSGTPWTFVFENVTSLYVADTSSTTAYNLVHYTFGGSAWETAGTVLFAAGVPVYSIAGRTETLGFAVYGATPVAIYRYDAATGAVTLVATPSAGVYRGVALAPVNPTWYAPSPLATHTATVTQTGTTSSSATPSVSGTSSNTQGNVLVHRAEMHYYTFPRDPFGRAAHLRRPQASPRHRPQAGRRAPQIHHPTRRRRRRRRHPLRRPPPRPQAPTLGQPQSRRLHRPHPPRRARGRRHPRRR
jgi:hypothetical protein